MGRLTMDQILRENQCRDISSLTSLQLSHRALSDVSCLSNFQNLEKLDLSYSCLTSLEGLSACVNLKWLQVLENKLVTLKGIESLSKLMVLNAGRNKLEKMDDICAVTSLRALILNDNDISSICHLDKLIYLNTLVLSRNPIHVIGNSLEKVTSLVKLSISHCKLETIGSSLVACVELKEARFSHNKITALPKELANNIWLRTLDMGSNLIEKLSEIKVLSDLPNLKNLNLLGNPIAANDKMIKKVRKLVPNVSIFNTKPTERSTSYVKSSEIAAFPQQKADSSLQISFGAKDSKKSKKREPRQDDDAFERNALNNSLEETMADDSLLRSFTDIEVERKVKKIKPGADADISVAKKSKSFSEIITDNAATSMEMKKKKPASNTDVWKSNSAYLDENIHPKIEHISKRKESYGAEAGALFYEFDDAETPFVDLIVSGKKKTRDDSQRKKGREAHHDTLITDGIVIESNKKAKRRFKKMDPGLLAMFSSEHEVGMGGASTWDA